MAFNPNELILEKIRAVEEYDPSTGELTGRYTQIEDPSLTTSADGQDVTDAQGTPIYTFYRNQTATLSFTNSLFSLDLAASQWGTQKVVADGGSAISMPTSEILKIDSATHTVTLKHTPIAGSLKFAKVVNSNKTFGETYALDTEAGAGKFTLAEGTLTFPDGVEGRVFVNYTYETTSAVSVTKTNDSVPEVKCIWMHAIFHDPCNANLKYAGVIVAEHAQIDPSSIEINLTSDGKHGATYQIRPDYCNEDASVLLQILVSEK